MLGFLLLTHSLALVTVISSCSSEERRAKPMPESASAYVYSYTSGIISNTSSIRVQFAGEVAAEEAVGQAAPEGLIRFRPSIAGRAIWESPQVLLFQPASPLPPGTAYVATVALGEIFSNVPQEDRSFEFDFRTRDLSLTIELGGLETPDPQDLSEQQLTGMAYTSDQAKAAVVEAALTAHQGGKTLPVDWTHNGQGMQHEFTVQGVARGETATQVEVRIQYDGFSQEGTRTLEYRVPALGDFELTNVRVGQGQELYLDLFFSDPLDPAQDFRGMVTIEHYNGSLRYLADGNRLRVYPSGTLTGTRQITVSKGVKNSMGKPMQKAGSWEVDIQEAKPQVRLAGTGVILPQTQGLSFPFEAINLKAVEVEVFKIYHNNILQFLQNNQLSGNSSLQEVGRIIKQVKVPLHTLSPEASANGWARYALRLDDLVQTDPQAIYQIRIGFRPQYALYGCPDAIEEPEAANAEAAGEAPQSIMQNWYGFSGYYEGYSWADREDPCKPAYYNSDRFVSRNVIASNIGLLAKAAEGGQYQVFATDLRTAQPLSGINLEFYDYQQQRLGGGQTDSDGQYKASLDRPPFLVVARRGQERGYLRLQDGDALSLSQFDVEGTAAQEGLKGFLYADRGVWRPGDSVFLNFIIEDELGRLPSRYPITFELRGPRGQVREQRTVTNRVPKIYPLHFASSTEAPTGIWRATVKAGGATFNKNLRIETVKPNRLKINFDFGKERIMAADAPFTPDLSAQWLHGAPAAGLNAVVEAQLQQSNTVFKGFSEFEFDDPARSISMEPQTVFEGPLNQAGQAAPSITLTNQAQLPGRLTASFRTRVFERGGGFSIDNFSLPYDPYAAYAGIRIPRNQYGYKRLTMGQAEPLEVAALTPEGQPVANRRLSIGLYRVDWRWWWDRSNGNVSRYNTATHYGALEKAQVTTGANGRATWNVTANNWGRYLVRVCDTETGHCSGDFFYAGSPWYGEEEGNRDEAAMLPFSADQDQYEVGETVTLQLPDAKAGRILLSLETGTEVLDSRWIEAEEGSNTISFEATSAMAPTVYAHLTLLQPHGQVENDLPIRLYGVIPIPVEAPATHLRPQAKVAKALKPRADFAIQVSEAAGQPMAYTLAVVDEGLLGLTRFETPAPWSHFYAREALGVRTWDLYDEVLGAYGGQLDRMLSIGGDAAAKVEAAKKANRFDPVAMHLGPFYLEKGQTATHQLTMPNYVGAVRVMVVAAEGQAYGHTEQTVPVRQPLMVLGTLPRVLGPGETLQLPVNVFTMQEGIRDVKVSVRARGNLVRLPEASRNLQFSQPGDQMVYFPVEVAEKTGTVRFTIVAEGHGQTATQDIELQIRNPNPIVTEVEEAALPPGKQHAFAYELLGMAGTNAVTLEVSNIPPINLEKRLDYLIRYPYGCLEQTLSSGFPQLYVSELLEVTEQQQKQLSENIKGTVNRLMGFQIANGGMAYWPGSAEARPWPTTYAAHFMLEAKALSYFVPPTLLERLLDYQSRTARLWSAGAAASSLYQGQNASLDQAYRLYTLALAQQPDLSAMNRLRAYGQLNAAAKWRLAAAYALVGKQNTAQQLINSADTNVPAYQELGGTFGSGLRDRAMILETLVLMGKSDEAAALLKSIAEQLSSERWLNTQETAYALLAIGKYVKEGGNNLGQKITFRYTLDGDTQTAGTDKALYQVEISPAVQRVEVDNSSEGLLFARLIRSGQPLAGAETPASNQLNMSIVYQTLEGQPLDPTMIPQGMDFVAAVTLKHPGHPVYQRYRELALEQIFPSGWEIMNTRMDNLDQFPGQQGRYDYQDIRDDRVYTFFNLDQQQSETFYIQLNAAYQGRFYLPAVKCAAMYKADIEARSAGQWVEVGLPGES